jgi:hypothetical protein
MIFSQDASNPENSDVSQEVAEPQREKPARPHLKLVK